MREPRLGNVSASCSVENEKGSETIQIAVGPMGLPMGLPMGQPRSEPTWVHAGRLDERGPTFCTIFGYPRTFVIKSTVMTRGAHWW